MRRLIHPIKKIYSEEASYRNFLRQEYLRHLRANRKKVEEAEEESEKGVSAEKLYSAVLHHKVLAVVFAVMLAALMFFYASKLASIIMVILLLVLASFSTVYKRMMGMPLGGVELITFGTVLVAVAFNPVIGLLFGIVSSLASEIISRNIGPLTWVYVFITGLLGFLAGYLSHLNIVFLGVAFAVASLLLNQVIYLFIGDADVKSMTVVYISTNLIFNIILFTTLGIRVLSLFT
jgi:ABC-type multidrug transport system fused ATPase/permease subunit